MSKHERFIRTPIEGIIEDAITASRIGVSGIEAYPLCDYIIQSCLLRMTGFSEQKAKCILWELATDNYTFRYQFLGGKNKYGECSNISSKNEVLKNMLEIIDENDYSIDASLVKKDIIKDSFDFCQEQFVSSILSVSLPRKYNEFLDIMLNENLDLQLFVGNKNSYSFFTSLKGIDYELSKAYEHLYRYRNRVAHNLLSYQENLPNLSKLLDEEYDKYDNWFVWVWMLVVMDRLVIRLFEEYDKSRINMF